MTRFSMAILLVLFLLGWSPQHGFAEAYFLHELGQYEAKRADYGPKVIDARTILVRDGQKLLRFNFAGEIIDELKYDFNFWMQPRFPLLQENRDLIGGHATPCEKQPPPPDACYKFSLVRFGSNQNQIWKVPFSSFPGSPLLQVNSELFGFRQGGQFRIFNTDGYEENVWNAPQHEAPLVFDSGNRILLPTLSAHGKRFILLNKKAQEIGSWVAPEKSGSAYNKYNENTFAVVEGPRSIDKPLGGALHLVSSQGKEIDSINLGEESFQFTDLNSRPIKLWDGSIIFGSGFSNLVRVPVHSESGISKLNLGDIHMKDMKRHFSPLHALYGPQVILLKYGSRLLLLNADLETILEKNIAGLLSITVTSSNTFVTTQLTQAAGDLFRFWQVTGPDQQTKQD